MTYRPIGPGPFCVFVYVIVYKYVNVCTSHNDKPLALLCFALLYFIILYFTLLYFTLPYLTLPYLTLPYLTLPYLTMIRVLQVLEATKRITYLACRLLINSVKQKRRHTQYKAYTYTL